MGQVTTFQRQRPSYDFVLQLTRDPAIPERWLGRMDVPPDGAMQGTRAQALSNVQVTASSIAFEVRGPEGSDRYELQLEAKPAGLDEAASAIWRPMYGEGNASAGGMVNFPVKVWRVTEREALDALPRRPQSPRGPFPYTVFDLTFVASDGVQLAGTIFVPEPGEGRGTGPFPGMVLLSGDGPQDRNSTIAWHQSHWILADALARAGIATLRFDDRGVGESSGAIDTSRENRIADVQGALTTLAGFDGIDRSRLGLLGRSEGASLAAEVAVGDANVKWVVMLAPPSQRGADGQVAALRAQLLAEGESEARVEGRVSGVAKILDLLVKDAPEAEVLEAIKADIRTFAQQRPGDLPSLTDAWIETQARNQMMFQNRHQYKQMLREDPDSTYRRLSVPVLAIAGGRDVVHTRAGFPRLEESLKAAATKDVSVELVEGVNHMMQPSISGGAEEYVRIETTLDPRVLQRVVTWVREKAGVKE
jgi:pimeloyl-ACP methyl ester carboxylesterase